MAVPKLAAKFAAETLEVHQKVAGNEGDGLDLGSQMAELIADLMHLAEKEGIHFPSVLDQAQGYYEADFEGIE